MAPNSTRLTRCLDSKLDEIRILKKKTKNVEKAIILFNNSRITETIKFLINVGVISSNTKEIKNEHELGDTPAFEFANFLYETIGLDKNKIGEFLGRNKPFNLLVLDHFFGNFNFQNMAIDTAMRRAFKQIRLPKEFQEIERIIYALATVFFK